MGQPSWRQEVEAAAGDGAEEATAKQLQGVHILPLEVAVQAVAAHNNSNRDGLALAAGPADDAAMRSLPPFLLPGGFFDRQNAEMPPETDGDPLAAQVPAL